MSKPIVVKAGDEVYFKQKDGQCIRIFVGENHIIVKSDIIGTTLAVHPEGDFSILATSVNRPIPND